MRVVSAQLPLGHQINFLSSSVCGSNEPFRIRGSSSPTGTRPSGCGRVRHGGSVADELSIAWAASTGFSRSQILAAPQPAAASRGLDVTFAGGRCHALQTPSADVDVGQTAVVGTGAPEAAIAEHGDPSAAHKMSTRQRRSHPARAGRRRTSSRVGAVQGATPSPAGCRISGSGAALVKSPGTMLVGPGQVEVPRTRISVPGWTSTHCSGTGNGQTAGFRT
jgi:hypothetical protein